MEHTSTSLFPAGFEFLANQRDDPNSLFRLARGQVASAVADGFFGNLPRFARYLPLTHPSLHNVKVERNISYSESNNPDWTLDVYCPTKIEGRRCPVVFYVHGGGFSTLSKDTHWIMGLAFARAGYIVFNINYRLAPEHPFPAGLEDTCTAYRWVLDHAEKFGGDTNRLVVAGESAGANLVTALTIACCYERPEPYAQAVYDKARVPDAVLATCGILQVSDIERYCGANSSARPIEVDIMNLVRRRYVGKSQQVPGLADPLLLLEQGLSPQRPLPPFMAAVGGADPLLDDTLRLKRALNALDAECDAPVYENEMHAFFALVWRRRAQRCWRDMYAFLDRNLPFTQRQT